MKVVALSCFCVDIFVGSGDIYPGGNALNFAVGCSRANVSDIYGMGAVGRDDYGQIIKNIMKKYKIKLDYISELDRNTATHKIHIDKDGDRYFSDEDWNGGAFEDYRLTEKDKDLIVKADIVATTYNDPNIKDILELRARNDFKLVVDFQDSREFKGWEKLLDLIDIYFISGDKDILHILREWSHKHNGLFVSTLGSEGSRAYHDGLEYKTDAIPADNVIDTTGCGDAYQAAFTVSYFRDKEIEKAMRKGSRAAAEVLTYIGGVK